MRVLLPDFVNDSFNLLVITQSSIVSENPVWFLFPRVESREKRAMIRALKLEILRAPVGEEIGPRAIGKGSVEAAMH